MKAIASVWERNRVGPRSPLGGEAYFAPPMQWRLWRGLRSFPRQPRYARLPPNCDVHVRDRQRPLNVDTSRPECVDCGHARAALQTGEVDPLLSFKIGPVNDREARVSPWGAAVAVVDRNAQIA